MDEKPWVITEPSDRGPRDVSAELDAELHRVGVSMHEARFGDGVIATDAGDYVQVMGPPRKRPRKWWRGSETEALELLAGLKDGAGVAAFWDAFAHGERTVTNPS